MTSIADLESEMTVLKFEESEEDVAANEKADSPRPKKTFFAASSDLESQLADPELKDVATKAARNIVDAARS